MHAFQQRRHPSILTRLPGDGRSPDPRHWSAAGRTEAGDRGKSGEGWAGGRDMQRPSATTAATGSGVMLATPCLAALIVWLSEESIWVLIGVPAVGRLVLEEEGDSRIGVVDAAGDVVDYGNCGTRVTGVPVVLGHERPQHIYR